MSGNSCCCAVGGCCHTNQCCCGCVSQKIGIIIAGVIDIGLTLILAVLSGLSGVVGVAVWDAVVIIGDILLIVGVAREIPGLLIAWLVIGMMNIVGLFSGWIWIRRSPHISQSCVLMMISALVTIITPASLLDIQVLPWCS